MVPGGVDLLFDGAGGQTRDQALDAVRDGGRAISPSSCKALRFSWSGASLVKSFAAHGGRARLGGWLLSSIPANFARRPKPSFLPLDQAREALARVAAGHTRGKIALQIGAR